MVTKLSPRDRWLLAFIPALLIVVLYVARYARPTLRERATLRQELAALGPTDALQAQLDGARAEGGRLSAEWSGLQQAEQHRQAETIRTQPSRLEVWQGLSSLCQSCEVMLIRAAPGGERIGSADASNQVWQLELRGSFAAVKKFLDGIVAQQLPVLPAGLGMDRSAHNPANTTWTMTVWL